MEQQHYGGGGGNWKMVSSNSPAPHSNQDQLYSQSFQTFHNQPPPQQFIAPQQPHHQSLASHFNLSHMVQNLAEAIDNGTRDSHFDSIVNELNTHFDQCQQLLNHISASISPKSLTADDQKQKLEETEQMIKQRRDLIEKHHASIEELLKSEM